MKKIKIFGLEILIALLLGSFTSYLYLVEVSFFENINKKFTDLYLSYNDKHKADDTILIIDIDEKSLSSLGQWPWSRDKVAQLLTNLANANIGIVGLDVVFAEKDNSSPKKVLKKLGMVHKDAKDYDEIFAFALANTPTVTGYLFDFEKKIEKGITPNIPVIIVEKNKSSVEFLPKAKGLISNIFILQDSSYSSGFFNTIPDNDGIVRSIPLVVKYENTIYPSLSLEMIRLILGSKKIVVNYSDIGISSVDIGELVIPTDRFGRIKVNYVGKAKSYKYISAVDIYNNEFKIEDVAGKIALLGTSAGGLLDLRATPLESVFPGVEIHANALDNIINQNFIYNPNWVEAIDIIIIISVLLLIVLLFTFLGAIKTALFFIFAVSGFIYTAYIVFIEQGIVLNIVYPFLSSILLYMILTSLHYMFETKQKELIKNKLSKKVSKAVAESLIKQGEKDILEAKEKEISVFFSDIRGFTSISEKLANPKKLIDFLNLYMTPMTEIIITNKGTVDKFIGDAIMAYWNAPLDIKDHADKAVKTAIAQIKELEKLNISLREKKLPSIDIGIGINSGLAVVGEMGSKGRSDYTIIGDNVNLGSRLEGLCKTYGAKIIISEYTKEKLKDRYSIRKLDKVRVKGKETPVLIYEIMTYQDKLIKEFEEAFELYEKGFFSDALIKFKNINEKDDTILYSLYIDRCEFFIQNPPKDFDGVFVFNTK